MKATNAIKRVEKAANENIGRKYGNVKMTAAYRLIMSALNNRSKTLRPCYTSGHGRFTTNQDHTGETCAILTYAGIKFVLSNDAPRGSATGNLITFTHIEF